MNNRFIRWLLAGALPMAFGSLVCFIVCAIAASPRWNNPVAAWLAPMFLLYYSRLGQVRRKFLWLFVVLFGVYVAAMNGVVPFPLPVLVVIGILQSLKTLTLAATDRWLMRREKRAVFALFYPCAAVLMEYLTSLGGSGAWGSVANSQYVLSWLAELASVTGIWGISFLLYSFGSLAVWVVQHVNSGVPWKTPVLCFCIVLTLVLAGGAVRLYRVQANSGRMVRVAGVSVPVLDLLQAMYKDHTGKEILLDQRIDLTSAALQKTIPSRIAFIESADPVRFKTAFAAMYRLEDSLFTLSEEAAKRGARLICWSEGSAIVFRGDEAALLQRGRLFSSRHRVFLLMAVAVMDSGRITPGKKFLENKTVLFDADGTLLNVFHKNNPVPMAESSRPGDGRIPVISTGIGRLSPSICYDADFPRQMRQLGQGGAELLMLPSGDWNAIASYHSQMAMFRAIENGCSILRQTSGGLSAGADYRGKMYGQLDYFEKGTKLWVSDLRVERVRTIYSYIGDMLVYVCGGMVVVLFILSWRRAKVRKG